MPANIHNQAGIKNKQHVVRFDGYQNTSLKEGSTPRRQRARCQTFAQVDEILEDCLDGLMTQFQDSALKFDHEYFAARRIVNVPGTRAGKTTPAPAPA